MVRLSNPGIDDAYLVVLRLREMRRWITGHEALNEGLMVDGLNVFFWMKKVEGRLWMGFII